MSCKTKILIFVGFLGIISLYGCSSETPPIQPSDPLIAEPLDQNPIPTEEGTLDSIPADVISVAISGEEGAYQFSVEISSPDEGCDQYADWWEVVDQDGELLYRRILSHSHVNEQPFTRSGGPVKIAPDSVVWVRAHMHPTGYGGAAMKGSAAQGFVDAELGFEFAPELAESPPLPDGCGF